MNTGETQKKPMRRRRIAAVVAALAVLGVSVTPTVASWSDEASTGGDFQTGQFDLEVRVGNTGEWTPASDGQVQLPFDSLTEGVWAPGDQETVDLQIRLSEDTTHPGVLSKVELESQNALGITWTLGAGHPASTGVLPVVSGRSGVGGPTLESRAFTDITYVDMGDPEMAGEVLLSPGEPLDLRLSFSADEDLEMDAQSDATWTFLVELEN
ncbi:SipW-dependent-type signal peptide-containing protein [Nesterenkonia rhizosphaerae]|uniref:Ribosomally synthesized peptide with SipW-like signal peptide n=1 Tax=Nesterenkonia rhizosphaerae TaxID=1348272 RepID=A0ABP9G137_9MICC